MKQLFRARTFIIMLVVSIVVYLLSALIMHTFEFQPTLFFKTIYILIFASIYSVLIAIAALLVIAVIKVINVLIKSAKQ